MGDLLLFLRKEMERRLGGGFDVDHEYMESSERALAAAEAMDRDLRQCRENIAKLLTAVGEAGTCRGCGVKIYWVLHRNGRRAPYTEAGQNHFIDCPKAKDFKK